MCDWNSGCLAGGDPLQAELSTSGRMKPSSLSAGQWSVCSAMLTSYFSATTCANSASATAPVTMSLTGCPEANSAPPHENWMMPSLPASANPRRAATSVCDDVQLIAG